MRGLLLTKQQHAWVEEADSCERWKARATFQRKIEVWKANSKKLAERPTFDIQVSSRSFPSWPALGRVFQRWNECQGCNAREYTWVTGKKAY